MKNIQLFNFPLNIAIIDDDTDYLDLLQQRFKNKILSTYNSPTDALRNITPIDIKLRNFLEEKFVSVQDLNYENIKNIVEKDQNTYGILIVDYDMPQMNGIELLSEYKDSKIIKILLTNTFTIDNAIEALHDKTIDYYLPKERIDILFNVVDKLQNLFFTDLTQQILNFLDLNSLNFLFDESYIKIFNDIYQQYDIKKYYILNSYGSYCLDNGKDKFILSIYSSSDLQEIAKEFSENNKDDVEQGYLIPSYLFNKNINEYRLVNAKKYGSYSYCIEQIV